MNQFYTKFPFWCTYRIQIEKHQWSNSDYATPLLSILSVIYNMIMIHVSSQKLKQKIEWCPCFGLKGIYGVMYFFAGHTNNKITSMALFRHDNGTKFKILLDSVALMLNGSQYVPRNQPINCH